MLASVNCYTLDGYFIGNIIDDDIAIDEDMDEYLNNINNCMVLTTIGKDITKIIEERNILEYKIVAETENEEVLGDRDFGVLSEQV